MSGCDYTYLRKENEAMQENTESAEKVTVQTGMRIYCAYRKKMIQECKKPIAGGDISWLFACNRSACLNCYLKKQTGDPADNIRLDTAHAIY